MTILSLLYAWLLSSQFRSIRVGRSTIESQSSSSLSTLLRVREYHVVSLAFFMFCAMLWVLYACTPTVIHDRYHLNLTESGITGTLYLQSGAAVGVLLGGWIGDAAGTRRPNGRLEITALGLILCAPFSMLMFITHSLVWLKASAVIFGITSGFFVANLFASLHDLVGHENFGLATGLVNMIGGLGAGAAVLLAGVMRGRGGIGNLLKWTSTAAVLAGAALLLFRPQRVRTPAETHT